MKRVSCWMTARGTVGSLQRSAHAHSAENNADLQLYVTASTNVTAHCLSPAFITEVCVWYKCQLKTFMLDTAAIDAQGTTTPQSRGRSNYCLHVSASTLQMNTQHCLLHIWSTFKIPAWLSAGTFVRWNCAIRAYYQRTASRAANHTPLCTFLAPLPFSQITVTSQPHSIQTLHFET